MKKIGFIGAYDKTNMLMYLSKIFVESGLKVLVIDTTILQKSRYTIPAISPSRCYITSHEGIDVAIGFETIDEIKHYAGVQELEYDFILMDIDQNEKIKDLEIQNNDVNYFVTGFDDYSLKRGLEIVGKDEAKIKMSKILFSKHMEKTEEEYLNFLSFYYAIEWNKGKIYFPFDDGDESVIIENQRAARISFRELSLQYKDGLMQLVEEIAPEVKLGSVKKMFKNI